MNSMISQATNNLSKNCTKAFWPIALQNSDNVRILHR
ncbi:unnamed protein product, partial [Tenebrio molitor]